MAKKKNATIQVAANQIVISNDTIDISPYLFNLDRVEKPNCIMCQSEHREEVEQMYENQKKKNYSAIKNKLKDDHDFDISRDALRNHLVRHYGRINNNISLQDFSEFEVQPWVDMQGSKVVSIKSLIAVLEREYFTIANMSDDLDLFERRKSAECLKKLAETILVCGNKLAEYSEEAKPVNILFNQLNVIVNDEMQHIDSVTSQKLVRKILARLKESCGNMLTG